MCDVPGLLATRISSIARIYPDQREHPEAVYTILGGCFPKLFSRKTWIQAPGMFPPATCGTMPGRAIRKWDMSFRPVLMLRALWYTDILKNTVCNHRHLEPEPQNGKTAGLSTRLEFSFYIRPLGDRDPYELLFSGISGWRVFSMDVYPCAN